MKRLHATIYGRVQGVGFRQNTALRARQLGITGWVRNLANGAVETVAEGEDDLMEMFLDFLQRGPVGARVTDIKTEWDTPQGDLTGFDIW